MNTLGWLGRQVRRVSVDPWRSIDRDGRPDDAGGFDLGILVLMVTTAVALTVAFYVGGPTYYGGLVPVTGQNDSADAWVLHGNLWSAAVTVVSCLGLPPLVFACVPRLTRRRPRARRGLRLGRDPAVLAGGVGRDRGRPAVAAADPAPSAARVGAVERSPTPPRPAALIVLLFGYGVAILRPRFGAQAVYAMLIPFVMFHYGRHHGELLGAALALVVLCGGDRGARSAAPSAARRRPQGRRGPARGRDVR